MIFFSLSYNPDLVGEFIPNKRDKLLSKKIKFKYENIKSKKRMSSGSCITSKLYDKIIKMSSKSHETIPLKI
jgi:hypothetical protein